VDADPNAAVQRILGKRIRDRRQVLGLSQEEMAARCGLHRTYYGSVERGERNIALQNIVRIADALDLDPSDLVGGLTLST
jgi:transcriptional regulator with XRE-family HTH domain